MARHIEKFLLESVFSCSVSHSASKPSSPSWITMAASFQGGLVVSIAQLGWCWHHDITSSTSCGTSKLPWCSRCYLVGSPLKALDLLHWDAVLQNAMQTCSWDPNSGTRDPDPIRIHAMKTQRRFGSETASFHVSVLVFLLSISILFMWVFALVSFSLFTVLSNILYATCIIICDLLLYFISLIIGITPCDIKYRTS